MAYLTTTLSADVTEARERIENLAQNDALTGLFNPRAFNEFWSKEHVRCEGSGTYSLLMVDIDRLKEINETFGHEAGNSAITLVAECLQRSIRGSDFAGSLGPLGNPEEFVQDHQELRGGMNLSVYTVKFPKATLSVWTYEMPDGKLEQYQVAAKD